jgi:poly-gamma-glutamate capsule biosynthesis protein CapA/YwtB (metallophosphatase superfamily)
LELYKERGWPYYGGGANLEEARRPLLMEHNGNQIAFLGCNGKAPWYARASETEPGAWHCDIPWMQAEIARLRAAGYLPIVTFQHEEIQTYEAHPKLKADFQPVADAGAVIVSGSQAHHPHAIEFRGDAFIHYGLGNLFFDQIYISDPNATAFIDRHIIYNGRHISTELLTIQFVDYARARPMTDTERQELLEKIFRVSIWN